jgi:hypothetical protein
MTGRMKSLWVMLVAVTAAIALGASAVPAAYASTGVARVSGGRTALVIPVAFEGGYSTPASTPGRTSAFVADQIRQINPWFQEVSDGVFRRSRHVRLRRRSRGRDVREAGPSGKNMVTQSRV